MYVCVCVCSIVIGIVLNCHANNTKIMTKGLKNSFDCLYAKLKIDMWKRPNIHKKKITYKLNALQQNCHNAFIFYFLLRIFQSKHRTNKQHCLLNLTEKKMYK